MSNNMLDYNDIIIKPVVSSVTSQEQVDISLRILRILDERKTLSLPLLTRVGGDNSVDICGTLSNLGILGTIDNLDNIYNKWLANRRLLANTNLWGMTVEPYELSKSVDAVIGLNPTIIEIRSGSGYSYNTLKLTEKIKKHCVIRGLDSLVLSGNVVTFEGANALQSAGADMVKVGNPDGKYFYSQLMDIPRVTAIQDCWNADVMIVADERGLNIGDFIKSLVVGADLYMVNRIVPDDFSNPETHITTLFKAYSNDLRNFCMSVNATTLSEMRNNSEILVK